MTTTVNLLCVLKRTVKIPGVFICGANNEKKSSHMWLAKPAIPQSRYKKKKSVHGDKNSQSYHET